MNDSSQLGRPFPRENPRSIFLTTHSLVLVVIARQSRITTREVSKVVGMTEKSVQAVTARLCAEGYLSKTRTGRSLTYDVNRELPLGGGWFSELTIGDLLRALEPSTRVKPGGSAPQPRRREREPRPSDINT